MRTGPLLAVGLCLALSAALGLCRSEPGQETQADRIAGLIRQLGDPEFKKREAAGKELDDIGAPAFEALRKAVADNDPEVRRQAARVLQGITARIHEAAARTELPRWQGDWAGKDGQKMAIRKDQWASSSGSGKLKNLKIQKQFTEADLVIEDGSAKPKIFRMILRPDGDTLHCCGSYEPTRPTEFKTEGKNDFIAWQRVDAKAAYFSYFGNAVVPGVPIEESKEPVRAVRLRCWLSDGGPGVLTLDPNGPKFNEFGDAVPAATASPPVFLDCTLKLVKKEKDRQLFELCGPKIASRLSLAAFPLDSQWGDGRLLVHGKDGAVRFVIPLTEGSHRTVPCHPGCFPAGTLIRIPGGTRPIERIREGDLVTTIDAAGKASSARVTGVFVARNRVLTVRVEGAKLVTTETQPVALAAGGFRPARELKAGDRVWCWQAGKRQAAKVLDVSAADREVEVFNLVLGDPKAFVAGDLLVRSKPPPVEALPVSGAAEAIPPP